MLFSAILRVFRDFLGEPGRYFLRFSGLSGISWENLGFIFYDFVAFPGFPGRTWVLFCGVSGISSENLGGNG